MANASEAHVVMLVQLWPKYPTYGRSCVLGPGLTGAVPYGLAPYGDAWWALWLSCVILNVFLVVQVLALFSHFFSQNIPVFKFKGNSMWISVSLRQDKR